MVPDNPNKCNFMALGDSDCTCNFTCNDTTVESSKGKNILGITIDDKLTFSPHLGNIFKKVNKKPHAIGRIKCYMGSEQNKAIISSFIKSQYSYCPLIWMFCLRTSKNKLNNITKNACTLLETTLTQILTNY